jgi:hypothetical protein
MHKAKKLKDSLCADLERNCYYLVLNVFNLGKSALEILLNLERAC